MSFSESFTRLAKGMSRASGHPLTFAGAAGIIVLWAVIGPLFRFSDTWQLVINTGTSVVTFLMVFLIQHTQNRDSTAMQIKLDELIRAGKGAQNALVDLENVTDEEMDLYKARFAELAARARARTSDQMDCPDLPEPPTLPTHGRGSAA